MVTEHSIVIVETADHQQADITLIVRSDDPAEVERVHALCEDAVRAAVRHVDAPMMSALKRDASSRAGE